MAQTYTIKGKAYWAKVVGKAPPGYENGPPEWSINVVPDEDGVKKLKELGSSFYLKDRTEGPTVTFKRKETKQDGTAAKPINIVDHNNAAWDNRLIGNGSTVNVAFCLNEVGTGKAKRLKPSILSLQVWDYVPYQPKSPFKTKDQNVDTDGAAADKAW